MLSERVFFPETYPLLILSCPSCSRVKAAKQRASQEQLRQSLAASRPCAGELGWERAPS